MFYITQIYGRVLQKAIEVSIHLQSDVQGKITYVADLSVGRGYVVTASTFDRLIIQIMKKVDNWRQVVNDSDQQSIMDKDDFAVLKQAINGWYLGE